METGEWSSIGCLVAVGSIAKLDGTIEREIKHKNDQQYESQHAERRTFGGYPTTITGAS